MSNPEKTGIELIAEERKEQIEKHGRTVGKDVEFNHQFQLSHAAAYLCAEDGLELSKDSEDSCPDEWSLDLWDKMMNKPYKERLIIAGALIAAEIDRLQISES